MGRIRTVRTYKKYTETFLDTLPQKAIAKFIWTFQLIEEIESVPITYLKHIEDGIRDFCLSRGLGDVYKRQIQYYCAMENACEAIITRNKRDFKNSAIPVLNAKEFVEMNR